MGEFGSSAETEPSPSKEYPIFGVNVFPGFDLGVAVEAMPQDTKVLVLVTDAGGGMNSKNVPIVAQLVADGIAVIVLPESANQSYGMVNFPDQPAVDISEAGGAYIESPGDLHQVYEAVTRALDDGLTGQELTSRVQAELALPVDAQRPSTDSMERMAAFQKNLEADGLAGSWTDTHK